MAVTAGLIVIFAINSSSNPEIKSPEFYNNNYNSTYKNSALDSINNNTQAKCHPSYSGVCLNPNASDYDCAGGSGNGPYYTGKVRVVGPDVFGLDRDGDGWGCE